MMAQKHLHELLKEDQEPFLLKEYVSSRRTQVKRPIPKTNLQVTKRKSIHQTSHFPGNLCKNACFYSFGDTPDLRKSPLFELASPVKSPCKSPNAIFLHIPARTAALLLEAALRIQKQSTSSKTKTQNKNNGFGLLGSLFRRLTQRNRNRKKEIEGHGVKVSVKDILRWDSPAGRKKISNGSKQQEQEKMQSHKEKKSSDVNAREMGFSCSSIGRFSSAIWSESNEDKSLDVETSTSGHSDDESEEIDYVSKQKHNMDCVCCDDGFCESPFRFVLQRSPSSGCRTPELPSPVSSPSCRRTEDKDNNNGAESLKNFQSGEEEEDKEQCSPVSVLDPPFEDDDDGHENDDGFDLECSYAIVQRTKQQLLYKLRRFEKLAELDPVELEKRMLEQEDDDETIMEEDECEDGYDDDRVTSDKEKDFEGLWVESIFCHDRRQIPEDLKRLVSDLIMEEEREANLLEDRETVMKRVRKRLEMWKEVESNTIDMMIEEDFCREDDQWKKNGEKSSELARELELAILSFLVEEFSEELLCLRG
ncbi:hypothetical protein L6164_033813 [Bauhinia variegata]|uniref:Uncharacterized protein n=1 Tax=Bauhinia variegata TaxID=167791 RepID=A0ACB9KT50_BAUVA|nr:hypothetical protein L6164_033813 [Bauhinia variegata]